MQSSPEFDCDFDYVVSQDVLYAIQQELRYTKAEVNSLVEDRDI